MTIYRHTLRHAPVGLWQFDGNLNDSSGNGFTLTVETGTVLYAEIAPGVRGAYFDGSTQLYCTTYNSPLNIQGDVTIEMLVMIVSYPSGGVNRSFVSHGAPGETYSTNFAYEFSFITGTPLTTRFLWEHDAGTNDALSLSALPALGVISHIAVTRTSNVVQFYLNGNAWGSPSSTLTAPNGSESGRFRIGDANPNSYAPNCILSSVKVVSKALTAAEIKAEYGRTLGAQYSTYAPPSNLDVVCDDTITINDAVDIPIRYHDTTHSPVGLWQLNGNLNDTSGNSRNLTIEAGTERYGEVFPGLLGFAFDGATNLIHNVNVAALQITGDITVEWLMLAVPSASTQACISIGNSSSETQSDNLLYNLHNNNWRLAFTAENGSGAGIDYILTSQGPLMNAPAHYAATRTSNVIQWYVNGQPMGAASGTMATPDGGSNGKLRIGSVDALASPFTGFMASIKIISSALSAAQVLAEYNRTVGRYYDSLVAL